MQATLKQKKRQKNQLEYTPLFLGLIKKKTSEAYGMDDFFCVFVILINRQKPFLFLLSLSPPPS